MAKFNVPDGFDELKGEMPRIMEVIARTARWVAPETFRALPVWYPETARGQKSYYVTYDRVRLHKKKASEVTEGNIKAQAALIAALDATDSSNWSVCHIWGIDDPKYQKKNEIVQDPKYYSCIGNMVWLPTPLKGFTDVVPEIKRALRTCAYHMYGWTPEHKDSDTTRQVLEIKSGTIPVGYPDLWPTVERKINPPHTAPYSLRVEAKIKKRKSDIQSKLKSSSHPHYPREAVRGVLDFWKIQL